MLDLQLAWNIHDAACCLVILSESLMASANSSTLGIIITARVANRIPKIMPFPPIIKVPVLKEAQPQQDAALQIPMV